MTEDRIIQVTVGGEPTQEELAELRDGLQGWLEDYPGNGKLIVTSERYTLSEIPALDDFADELAKRVAAEIGGETDE
jgi:hypothetical protein